VERPLPLARAAASDRSWCTLAESASIRSPEDMQPADLTTSFIFEPTIRISFEPPLVFLGALPFAMCYLLAECAETAIRAILRGATGNASVFRASCSR